MNPTYVERQLVYDPDTMSWVFMTQPTSGPGGGGTVDQGSGGISPWLVKLDQTGTNNDVDILTVPAPLSTTGGGTEATALRVTVASDSTGVLAVNPISGQTGVQGGSGTVSNTTQRVVLATDVALPAGTNAIGKLSSNDGIDIGDVTINNAAGASAVNIQDGGNTITVDGAVTVSGVGVNSTANSTTTPLGSFASFTGAYELVRDYASVSVTIGVSGGDSNGAGFNVEWSGNGVNTDSETDYTVFTDTDNTWTFPISGRYFRVRYQNGSTPQSTFRLTTTYHPVSSAQARMRPLATGTASGGEAPFAEDDNALMCHSTIVGYNSSLGVFQAVPTRGSVPSFNDAGLFVRTVGAVGSKTSNSTTPGDTNVGALTGVATEVAPTYVEGRLVALSTDLAGALRVGVVGTVTSEVTGEVSALALVSDSREAYTTGDSQPLSLTTDGRLRVATSPSDSWLNFFNFGDDGSNENLWEISNPPYGF